MLARFTRHLRALASVRTARIELLHGRLHTDGSQTCAVYAGNGTNAEYLLDALFAAIDSRRVLAHCAAFNLDRSLKHIPAEAEIIVCERPPLWAFLGRRVGEVRLAAWLRQELTLADRTERWAIGRHLEREVERLIRRHSYRLEFSQDQSDKEQFFADFYGPYIRARHGRRAVTADRKTFLEATSGATLAKLIAGDAWTAGMLLQESGSTLRFGWFGSKTLPAASGASEVLDVLIIRSAMQRGIRRISFGSSRPSLSDGVVRYKRKFGARFVQPRYPQTVIEIQMRSDRAALHEWFNAQQFVCRDGESFVVAAYSSSSSTLPTLKLKPIDLPVLVAKP